MMKFNREEGLTLIELLITIAVLAIVAAIAVPVVTNVVSSTNDRAFDQTIADINDFVDRGNQAGIVGFDGTNTFTAYVDLNGDNVVDDNEKISELVVDKGQFPFEGINDTFAPSSYDEVSTIGPAELP